MPGITGIISKKIDASKEIDRMIACMTHENSYNAGKYINKELGIYVGWVNHSGSFSDCLPIWNETKDICVIFSGEDFTDASDIETLKFRGHKFASENASYLAHLYEEKGLDFIPSLNGWFSGILVDHHKKNVVVFNDRYGLGRIYYHEKEDGFYFSSEAKAILKILPELRQIDYRSMAETFSNGCVLQDRTLFPGISLLPGGSRWVFNVRGEVMKKKYFVPADWEGQPLLDNNNYYTKLKEVFSRILPRYFRGNRHVAMSLTGGLDGRMIMAWSNCLPGELPCYTFGGTYRDCTDVRIAASIAKLFKQPHEVIVVDSKFTDKFPELAEKSVYLSDGTMDVTGSVELYVNSIAKGIAPVRLTGNYGSEIVRGNVAFRPGTFDDRALQPEFAQLIKNAAATYGKEREGRSQSFIAFKQIPWHHYSRFSVEQSQLIVRSPYLDKDLVALTYQASPELILNREPSLRLIAEGNPELARIPTDRGVLYHPNLVLGRIRNFYEEFTFKCEYEYDHGMPQWLARIDYFFKPLHLERLFLGRHKFYHFRVWYRDRLSQYLKEVLLDSRTLSRPYLNGKLLEEIVNSHIKGNGNFTSEIHRILTSELIQRQLVENL